MVEKIVYAPWISKKMTVRFDILDFCVDCDGFLFSPKRFDDNWDFQTKALYYRSINIGPERISKKLNLNVNTLKNREFLGLITLDYEGKNYKLGDTDWADWSTLGRHDGQRRHICHGGVPKITDDDHEIISQFEMDAEFLNFRKDINEINIDEPELDPSEKLYREWYINDND